MTRSAWIGLGVVVGMTFLVALMDGGMRLPPPRPATTQAASPVIITPGRTVMAANVYASATEPYLRRGVSGIPARVYVPNSSDGTVDVIDPISRLVITHFPVGSVPHHITPSWDLNQLYVDNTSANTLTVIDPRTSLPVETIRIADPYNLYFTPDGTAAIVVAERLNRLDVYDWSTWPLLFRVPVPWPGVDHLDFSADGHILLTSAEFSGAIVKVDLTRRMVVGYAYVGGLPVDVRLAPDGSVFFVANQGRHGVSVLDPERMEEIAFIPTGLGAHGLALNRDASRLYVSNRLAGTISVIDLAARRVAATWDVGGSPDMMQGSPDGRGGWARKRFGHTVSV